ncbi:unnamed protein product [Rotaria socialis]|uniref:ADP-ribosylation factor-like protein 2-binding protein n=1 Tax=Rotaria socialis TaxID=392032 RepID=A0A819VJC6_9BILA|nr:unnamed protein product [Rotaria socialis]CAF3470552.1 unnamed protein product [Rotaria socialis]CAF3494416.1 unnamed protein product [Rotaria socialis]CAF4109773.1 unnamed protein product [Rotaria socialis]CAF4393903.1 unnamed protein product [Rotaria socialis]
MKLEHPIKNNDINNLSSKRNTFSKELHQIEKQMYASILKYNIMAGITRNLNFDTNENIDETFASHKSQDPEVEKFDRTIGLIEDMIMDEEFRSIQKRFLMKYAHEFDPELDENKLIYTDIHKEYLIIFENFITNKIKHSQSDFNLDQFMKQLEAHQNEVEEEIFEFLLTLTNFLTFKQWMLDYRRSPALDINSCV